LRQSEESYRNLQTSHDNEKRGKESWQSKSNQMEGEMISWRIKAGTSEQEKNSLHQEK